MTVRGLHDARLGIGEVALGLSRRLGLLFGPPGGFGDLLVVGAGALGVLYFLGAGALFGLGLDGFIASRIFAMRVSRRASSAGTRRPAGPHRRPRPLPVDRLGLSEDLAHLASSCSIFLFMWS